MYKFKFADIGEGLHEGTVAEVYKKVGDLVKEGESLFSVENEKMTSDIPSPVTGKITEVLLEEGKVIHVGDVIYVIDDASGSSDSKEAAPSPKAEVKAEVKVESPKVQVSSSNKEEAKAFAGKVDEEFDLIVVGAGPAGYLAAEEAGKYGLKTLIVEKEFWGGVCLNIGCIPTKALLNSTHYLQATQEAQEVGVVYKNANIEIDYKKSWKAIQAKKDAVVKQIVGGVKLLLKQPNIKVIEGTAEFVAAKAIKVDGKVYSAKNVILATGSVSRKLNLPGFDKAYEKGIAITSRSAINMQDYPSSLNIIGAGVIGLEMAQVYSTAGVKVNVIQNTDSILTDGISLAIRKALITRLEKDGVKFYFNSQVKEMKGKKLLFESNGEAKELEADYTLVSVGRVTVSLGVDKFGIKFDERGVIQVDDNFETNIAGFYAVGDVNAQKMLAHVAYSQAQEVVNRINGISHVYPKKNVPAVIYTNPEISFVGLTHKEAVDAGYKVVIGKYSYAHLGRAIATGKNEGFIEIYVDSETGKILGSQIFGANISDFIAEITLAMDNEITIYEIASTIHPHPSYAEIIWEAARGVVLKLHKSHK